MKRLYIATMVLLLLVGSVSAIGMSTTQAAKAPGIPVAIENMPHPGDHDDGPNTASREASGGSGGCAQYEDTIVNGIITPKCVHRSDTTDDLFWMLHPWLYA